MGCGRKPQFPELEASLYEWVKDRNTRGLRTEDKFIQAHAKNIRKLMLEKLNFGGNTECLDEAQGSSDKLEGELF